MSSSSKSASQKDSKSSSRKDKSKSSSGVAPGPNSSDTAGPKDSTSSKTSSPQGPPQYDFDLFQYLNADEGGFLRDPVLQQMTVVKYEGDIDSSTGFFHGQGKMVSTLGYVYTGAFQRGLMHGQGRLEWSDGTVYQGEFQDNAICGKGKYTWPCGDWYDGEVQHSVRHGKGIFFYKALNEKYDGGWVAGKRHGNGTLFYTTDNQCYYKGQWVDDRRTGRGIMVYKSGSSFDGDWLNDVRHGQGEMIWKKNGVAVEKYKGEWVNGTPNGQGTSTYIRPAQNASAASGEKDAAINTYTGEYVNGVRHGFGCFVYDDGSRYEGYWQNNLKHGEGKHTSATGVVFVGTFVDGNPTTPMEDMKPDTTVACPLPLFIRDVLGEAENNVHEAVVSVQSVVSRHNGFLRRVFQYYSTLEVKVDVLTTPPGWRKSKTQGTMFLVQFLRFCNDARLINKNITVAAIDRLLLALKDRNSSTTTAAYLAQPEVQVPLGGKEGSPLSVNPTVVLPQQDPTNRSETEESNKDRKESSPTKERRSSEQSFPPPPQRQKSVSTSSGASGAPRLSEHKSASITNTTPFNAPWEKYKTELHQFTGELNFRDFAEALVRVTAAFYADPVVFGSLSHRLQLVIDKHLMPFTMNPQTANPLHNTARDAKQILLPRVSALRTVFERFSRKSALGSMHVSKNATATTDPARFPDTTMSMRQFCILLREAGVLSRPEEPHATNTQLTVTDLLKLVPHDKYPQMTNAIYTEQFVSHKIAASSPGGQIPTSLLGGGRPGPALTPSTVASPNNFLNSTQSTQFERESVHSHDSDATSMAHGGVGPGGKLDETGESLLRSKRALMKQARGAHGRNFKSTLAMETELTFNDFVDVLAQVACATVQESTKDARIATLADKVCKIRA